MYALSLIVRQVFLPAPSDWVVGRVTNVILPHAWKIGESRNGDNFHAAITSIIRPEINPKIPMNQSRSPGVCPSIRGQRFESGAPQVACRTRAAGNIVSGRERRGFGVAGTQAHQAIPQDVGGRSLFRGELRGEFFHIPPQ